MAKVLGVNVLRFVVPGKPQPKQRARRTRSGHWYTPSQTVGAANRVGAIAMRERLMGTWAPDGRWSLDPWHEYKVDCVFYRDSARKLDGDNAFKLVTDACTGILWADDDTVGGSFPPPRIDRDNPRTEVTVTQYVLERPEPKKKTPKKHKLLGCQSCGVMSSKVPCPGCGALPSGTVPRKKRRRRARGVTIPRESSEGS